ncbi:MAG: DUF3006 family protein [Firmicutes bacterium]|nr:DUF3006 family protein [Bacillota bacterium]
MKFSVDRIEGNIIILQDLETKEIKEVLKKDIGIRVKDGDILVYKDNKYKKDNKLKEDRLKLIQEKLNKLKGLN